MFCTCGYERRLYNVQFASFFSFASAVMVSPSRNVDASGFSHITCLPASIAAMPIGKCSEFGVQMCTASISGSLSNSR